MHQVEINSETHFLSNNSAGKVFNCDLSELGMEAIQESSFDRADNRKMLVGKKRKNCNCQICKKNFIILSQALALF